MNEPKSSIALLSDELLKEVVQPLPVTDIHTHINGADPAAHDITEIIFYHYIRSELEAAGVSRSMLDAAKSCEEKVDLFLESYRRLANTITFWCLRRVLELHGIGVNAELTREALLEANEKVRATHAAPSWPRRTLVATNHVCKTALTLGITEKVPDFDTKIFFGTLRLDEVVSNVSGGTLHEYAARRGKTIDSLAAFERAAEEQVAEFARTGGRALTLGLRPEEDFVSVERTVADGLFDRILRGERLSPSEEESVHCYLLDFFASLAAEARLPLQLLLGVRRSLPAGAAVAVLHPGLVSRYAPLFHKFQGLSFDLLLASAAHSQESIATAKSYPNISLSGFWWYGFSPPYIRAMLSERLLALPIVKLHAFFSDAYNVEWSAGKLALLRHELSRVLAELIVSRYISESQTLDLAKHLLCENATRLYQL